MVVQLIIVCAILLNVDDGSVQRSGEDILRKMEAHFPGVEDYSVDLDVTADIERMNVPSMHGRMYYKQPDKFHFESDGFAVLPREGLAFSATRMLARFTVEDVKEEVSDQRQQFKLLLRPKDVRVKTSKIIVYVNPEEWKPTTIVSSLFDGRTITAMFQYEKLDSHLMPSLLTVEFTAAPADTMEQAPGLEGAPIQRPQMPRKGTITIKYSDYKINTGLQDDIFNTK